MWRLTIEGFRFTQPRCSGSSACKWTNQVCEKSALKLYITVKAPVLEASAAVFPAKTTAGDRFDIMDGAKKARFTEVLEQKWAELLIFKGGTGKQAKPVIRISNTWCRIRPYAPDLTAYSAKIAPMAARETVTGIVHGYAGNGVGIEQGLNVVSNP